MTAKTDEMTALELTYEGLHYRMDLWKPLKPPTSEQVYAAEDAVRLDGLINGVVKNQQGPASILQPMDTGPAHLGGLDQHKFFPQQLSGGLEHANSQFYSIRADMPPEPGAPIWLKAFLPVLQLQAAHHNLDDKMRCWIQRPSTDPTGTEQSAENGAPCMIYYISHPKGGAFYEVFADDHPCGWPCLISVYRLQEDSRSAQRVQVFTSDVRFCLRDPSELDNTMQLLGRAKPCSRMERFAAGWLFNGCYTSADGTDSEDFASVSLNISRDRSAERIQAENEQWAADLRITSAIGCWLAGVSINHEQQEVYIAAARLSGLIPHVLAASFEFWQGHDGHLRGYSASGEESGSEQWHGHNPC